VNGRAILWLEYGRNDTTLALIPKMMKSLRISSSLDKKGREKQCTIRCIVWRTTALQGQRGCFLGESERWSLSSVWMILIFNLDTDFTIKSMIRALKLV